MDPQMVWDAMDEEDAIVDTHTSLCQVIEPEDDIASYQPKAVEATVKKTSGAKAGWMGFPVYGFGR